MTPVYGFASPDDFNRFVRAGKAAEEMARAMDPFTAPAFLTAQDARVYVKITGPVVANNIAPYGDRRNIYPAEGVLRNHGSVANADDWWGLSTTLDQEGNECVAVTPNGEVLKQNTRYEGKAIGVWTIQDPLYPASPGKTKQVGVVMVDLSDANDIVRVENATPTSDGLNDGYLKYPQAEGSAVLVDGERIWIANYSGSSLTRNKLYSASFITRQTTSGNRAIYGIGASPGSAGGGDCNSCSWLADLPNNPPTQPRPCFLLKMRGGAGRCSCIGSDDTGDDSGLLMSYVDALSGWLGAQRLDSLGRVIVGGSAMARTCCGCGSAVFKLTGPTTATLTFGGVHVSCQDGGGSGSGSGSTASIFTIALTQECCGVDPTTGRRYVSFFGYGPDPCSGSQEKCDNTFHVRVECFPDCPAAACGCPGCGGDATPFAWYAFGISGFDNTRFNGDWVWTQTASCTWTASCDGASSTLTFVPGSPNKWQLTHGSTVYELTTGPHDCLGMTLTAASHPGAPETITLAPVTGGTLTCCGGCNWDLLKTKTLRLTVTDTISPMGGQTMTGTYDVLFDVFFFEGNFGGCDCPTELYKTALRCDQLNPGKLAVEAWASFCGITLGNLTATTCAPFVLVGTAGVITTDCGASSVTCNFVITEA